MSATYRAMEVTRPGDFSQVRRPLKDPGPRQVRIRVEACDVCHSCKATVEFNPFSRSSLARRRQQLPLLGPFNGKIGGQPDRE
jgi:hypothetical protein